MLASLLRRVGIFYTILAMVLGAFVSLHQLAHSAYAQGFVLDTADQPSSGSASAIASAGSGEAASSDDAGDVGPLDDWRNVKPMTLDEAQKASSAAPVVASSSANPERTYMDAEYYGFGSDDEANDRPTTTSHLKSGDTEKSEQSEVFEFPYRITSADRKMFERIEKRLRHFAYRYQRDQAKKNFVDHRGIAEGVVCSINLAGYGIPKEMDSLLKRKVPAAALKTLSAAIKEAGCDVVAVQGIIGRSKPLAEEAVINIRDALQKETETDWQFVVGDIENGEIFPATLIRRGRMRLTGLAGYGEMFLPRYAPFTLRKFPASPLMVSLSIPGFEGKRDRQALLFNFFIGENVTESPLKPVVKVVSKKKKPQKKIPDPEAVLNMMQIAEGLRQVIEMKQRSVDPDDPPLLIIAGERGDLPWGVVTRLLEGRQQLKQFKLNGNCALEEKFKEQCQEAVRLPQTLFGVAGFQHGKPGKLPRLDRTLSSDIYLTPDDLPLAYRGPYSTGEYATATRKLKFGSEQVVLHTLQLNW